MMIRAARETRWCVVTSLTAIALGCAPRREEPAADMADARSPDSASVSPVAQTGAIAAPGDTVTPLLSTGCSGGVTGGGSGTFVTASGHFYRYSHRGPQPNARQVTFLHRDSARAAVLVQAAEREGITTIKFSQPSNMTCSLSLDRGGTSHEVEWPIGTSPTQIRKLVEVAKGLQDAAAAK